MSFLSLHACRLRRLAHAPEARKGWRRGAAAAEALVPLVFAPGEAYQFDWSYEIVIVAGVTTPVTDLGLAVLAGVIFQRDTVADVDCC
jgi:hypothetical protein